MTAEHYLIPDDVRLAIQSARRTPGWNTRKAVMKRFRLGQCELIVVPARLWRDITWARYCERQRASAAAVNTDSQRRMA